MALAALERNGTVGAYEAVTHPRREVGRELRREVGRQVGRGVGSEVGREVPRDLPALYDQHYRSLVKLAAVYLDDVESAEEVVQDVFVKLLAGRYRVEPGKEGPYLRSMVLNGARSLLRKRHVRRVKAPAPADDVVAAEELGVARAERYRVVAAVRTLPHKQASVLLLRYYLELSEAEIADTLGIAPGSVKSHAHRALAKLQTRLREP
jgi:RNA polymerase sigma factor (sigma-70 family)